jgi:hypothetical protein
MFGSHPRENLVDSGGGSRDEAIPVGRHTTRPRPSDVDNVRPWLERPWLERPPSSRPSSPPGQIPSSFPPHRRCLRDYRRLADPEPPTNIHSKLEHSQNSCSPWCSPGLLRFLHFCHGARLFIRRCHTKGPLSDWRSVVTRPTEGCFAPPSSCAGQAAAALGRPVLRSLRRAGCTLGSAA